MACLHTLERAREPIACAHARRVQGASLADAMVHLPHGVAGESTIRRVKRLITGSASGTREVSPLWQAM